MRCPADSVDCSRHHQHPLVQLRERNAPLAVWRMWSLTLDQPLEPAPVPSFSFQMKTLPSKEHEARMEPKEGCAQERPWMGPSCLPSRVRQLSCPYSAGSTPGEDPSRVDETASCLSSRGSEERDSPPQRVNQLVVALAHHLEQPDGPVRARRGQASPVVVQLSVVLSIPPRQCWCVGTG